MFFTYSEKENNLAADENDVQGYIDDCLRKAHQITILEGQSNLSGHSDNNLGSKTLQDEIGPMELQSVLSSEREYFFDNDESLCDVSLREVGLDFSDSNNSLITSPMGSFRKNEDVNNSAHIVDKERRQDEDATNDHEKVTIHEDTLNVHENNVHYIVR